MTQPFRFPSNYRDDSYSAAVDFVLPDKGCERSQKKFFIFLGNGLQKYLAKETSFKVDFYSSCDYIKAGLVLPVAKLELVF
jgi:hypothetical protein